MATMNLLYEHYKEALRGESLPQAFVDLRFFDSNLNALIDQVLAVSKPPDRLTVRLATKSVRCVSLLKRAIELGNQRREGLFQGLMAFHPREAVWLHRAHNFRDILVPYPSFDRSDVAEIAECNRNLSVRDGIKLTVDSIEGADTLQAMMAGGDLHLSVCIDVDMSTNFSLLGGLHFGVFRSPIQSADSVSALVSHIVSQCPNLRLAGMVSYEAQIAGLSDAPDLSFLGYYLLNPIIRELKKWSWKELQRRRAEMVTCLTPFCDEERIVNGGGTGSLHLSCQDTALTEVTFGSGLFCPTLFDHYHQLSSILAPACAFAVPVVRRPAADMVTCFGGGYVASGKCSADRMPVPYLPPSLSLVTEEGCGEVQTPIRTPVGLNMSLGDPVIFRHAKAGEIAERFKEFLLISKEGLVDRVQTYRGENQAFG